ncbi:MAG: hypothetical protein HY744_22660 [Deltaproteobacteria bacterium]|nr:hypothetical protein [Deltaproteobacteria bacterium]
MRSAGALLGLALLAGCRAIMGLDELGVGASTATGGAGGSGGGAACVPESCPGVDTDCRKRGCIAGGKCDLATMPEGTQCQGQGEAKLCDGQGNCVECTKKEHCPGEELCDASKCVPPPCKNGKLDGGESDVDCGGKDCAPCPDGQKCSEAADCASGFCEPGGLCGACQADGECAGLKGYCEAGKCVAKKDQGEACGEPAQCQSGHCIDDVCCEEKCSGLCEVCSTKLGASEDGTCSVLPTETPCRPAVGACDLPEKCDGKSGECPGDVLVKDGKPSTDKSCEPYLCDGESATCPQGCTAAEDCIPGYGCYGGKCKKPDGEPCGGAGECKSGFCIDGVCCDTPCTGPCRACSLAKTGAKNGMCAPVSAGTDPDGECAPGVCTGSGTCAVGSHLWSKRLGDTDSVYGWPIAVDGAGNVLALANSPGTVDFGGGPLTSTGGHDIFVLKLAP